MGGDDPNGPPGSGTLTTCHRHRTTSDDDAHPSPGRVACDHPIRPRSEGLVPFVSGRRVAGRHGGDLPGGQVVVLVWASPAGTRPDTSATSAVRGWVAAGSAPARAAGGVGRERGGLEELQAAEFFERARDPASPVAGVEQVAPVKGLALRRHERHTKCLKGDSPSAQLAPLAGTSTKPIKPSR